MVDVDTVAREIFGLRGAWRTLLEWHVPDDHDRCRGCAEWQGPGHRWPCSLHVIATRARQMHDEHMESFDKHLGTLTRGGVCRGCDKPSEGIICAACEKAEREDREKNVPEMVLDRCPGECGATGMNVYRADGHPTSCVWMMREARRCAHHDELLRPDEPTCPAPDVDEEADDPHGRLAEVPT